MSPFLKIRTLFFGILAVFASFWAFRGSDSEPSKPEVRPDSSDSTFRVPVEVIAKGSSPQIVYIEVAGQALPESQSRSTPR